jgi:hypothetical protein
MFDYLILLLFFYYFTIYFSHMVWGQVTFSIFYFYIIITLNIIRMMNFYICILKQKDVLVCHTMIV